MAKAYSEDLRIKVISQVMSGCSKREAAQLFRLGEATVYRWVKMHKAGDLKPKKRTHYPCKVDIEKLKGYVAQNPDHTLKQIGEALGLKFQYVAHWLKRLKITRKKRLRFTESVMKKSGQSLGRNLRH